MYSYLSTFLVVLSGLSATHALWPVPRSLETGNSTLKLSNGFKITVNVPHAPADLSDAVQRTINNIKNDKLERLVVGRASADRAALQHTKELTSLTLSLTPGSPINSVFDEAIKTVGTRSEEYVLRVPANGSPATLLANSTLGLLRGLTTFEQLWYFANDQIYTIGAPIAISDSPAYVSLFSWIQPFLSSLLTFV